MEPNVKAGFDEVLRRLDALDARWEQRISTAETARERRDSEVDARIGALEDREASRENRVGALESFRVAQSTVNQAADDWGGFFQNRFSDVEERLGDLERARLSEIQDVAALETAMEDVRAEVGRLRIDPKAVPESDSRRPPAGDRTDWPVVGHGAHWTPRARDYGSVTTLVPNPANGMFNHLPESANFSFACPESQFPPPFHHPPPPVHPPPPFDSQAPSNFHHQKFSPPNFPHPHHLPSHIPPPNFHPSPFSRPPNYNIHPSRPPDPTFQHQFRSESTTGPSGHGKLPTMKFPQFNGDNPKLWLSRAKTYFEMYSVSDDLWVRICSMHCVDAAARWLQSVGSRLASLSWSSFSQLVLDRFGRDQRELCGSVARAFVVNGAIFSAYELALRFLASGSGPRLVMEEN